VRVHLVQMNIVWEDRAANHRRAAELVAAATISAGDLIILPEMFDTGFSFRIERTADAGGTSAKFLAALAAQHGATVLAGITAIGPDARGRNRVLAYSPAGDLLTLYDKAHPFTFGREGEFFTGGQRVEMFTWHSADASRSLRVCPTVCYDLRFPELFRAGLSMGAQAFAVVANWPSERAAHWRALSIARAIENQAFVFAVNRTGVDPGLHYAGGSLVIGPKGEVLAEADDREQVLSAEIEPAAVIEWRTKFRAWQDRKSWLS
jgi:omega-amidase